LRVYIDRESVGEKILKIGPHLSNIKELTFLGHSVYKLQFA